MVQRKLHFYNTTNSQEHLKLCLHKNGVNEGHKYRFASQNLGILQFQKRKIEWLFKLHRIRTGRMVSPLWKIKSLTHPKHTPSYRLMNPHLIQRRELTVYERHPNPFKTYNQDWLNQYIQSPVFKRWIKFGASLSVNKIQTWRFIHYFPFENITLSQWKSIECLDEAASSVATGRASVAGKTAVDGVGPSAAIQAAAPTLWRALQFNYLVTYL